MKISQEDYDLLNQVLHSGLTYCIIAFGDRDMVLAVGTKALMEEAVKILWTDAKVFYIKDLIGDPEIVVSN